MPVRLRVRNGELVDHGSWLYVWRRADAMVVYVGATGLPPAVRTWLHLHSEDPDVARVRSAYPRVESEDLDVIAFALPPDLPRADVKAELVRRLAAAGQLAENYDARDVGGDGTSQRAIADMAAQIVGQLEAEARPS